jgi:hypothetical protein
MVLTSMSTFQLIMIKRHLLEAEQKKFWYASGKESQSYPQEVPYGIVLWNGFAFKQHRYRDHG